MRIFSGLYKKVMRWSRHPRATSYLAGLSFAESSFFPIPPDVMLAPMCLKQPDKAWTFAALTSVFSVLGGILGFVLGAFFFDLVHPLIVSVGYEPTFDKLQHWFNEWGIWIIFIAGFSPIPYKLFTISAGVFSMSFVAFVIISLIARSARFFLVALLMKLGGEKLEKILLIYMDRLGLLTVFLIGLVLVLKN